MKNDEETLSSRAFQWPVPAIQLSLTPQLYPFKPRCLEASPQLQLGLFEEVLTAMTALRMLRSSEGDSKYRRPVSKMRPRKGNKGDSQVELWVSEST